MSGSAGVRSSLLSYLGGGKKEVKVKSASTTYVM